MTRSIAACLLIIAMLAGTPAEAQPIPVRVERLGPATIDVPLNAVHPEPLRFRVVRAADSAPLEGVEVYVFVNVIYCAPLLPCPFDEPGYFGEFLSDAPMVSDADGIVESSLFRAGWRPNMYEIIAWPPLAQGYTLVPRGEAVVQVNQFEVSTTIPSGSLASLALLIALVLALALRGRHGRAASR